MEDKLHNYFSENDFDFQEPHSGHLERFERKLNNDKQKQKHSWKWLSVAASIVLVLGFWLGSNHQKSQLHLADISPKMEEVENYFVTAINQELKTVEKNRSLNTETIIEQALNRLEDLEEDYNYFLAELNTNGNQTRLISAMIKNYQKRLEILQNVLDQIQQIKNPQILNDEIFI